MNAKLVKISELVKIVVLQIMIITYYYNRNLTYNLTLT